MLVLFSSMADTPFTASLGRRCFYRTWEKVQNYIPKNTYVLRIADIGGVIASFYLNSKFDPEFAHKVQRLIQKIADDHHIAKSDIILYGGSKGGTASLYHGVLGNYNTVAIDPIINDEYYETVMFDSHFTKDAFEKTKEEVFEELFASCAPPENVSIITSHNSPQFKWVGKILPKVTHSFIFDNPSIKKHADVSPNTLVFFTALMNSIWYGIYNKESFQTDY